MVGCRRVEVPLDLRKMEFHLVNTVKRYHAQLLELAPGHRGHVQKGLQCGLQRDVLVMIGPGRLRQCGHAVGSTVGPLNGTALVAALDGSVFPWGVTNPDTGK